MFPKCVLGFLFATHYGIYVPTICTKQVYCLRTRPRDIPLFGTTTPLPNFLRVLLSLHFVHVVSMRTNIAERYFACNNVYHFPRVVYPFVGQV